MGVKLKVGIESQVGFGVEEFDASMN